MSHHSVVISFFKKEWNQSHCLYSRYFFPVLFPNFVHKAILIQNLFGTYYHEDVAKEELTKY